MTYIQATVSKCSKISPVLPILFRKNSALLSANFMKSSSMNISTKTKATETENNKEITKSVFISQSCDIFTNLALEDWLYKNFDFTNHHIMLLWRNNPCVVIGRHQNPWLEADVVNLERRGVELARRNSGGGTVYHDLGNLNITFFAPKDRYNRKQNLELISRTLEKEWNLHPEINKKEDLVFDNDFKISGTASKLGRPNSYHHCTLLVDVDKDQLSKSLKKDEQFSIMTTATKSVPASTINLTDLNRNITMDDLFSSIGWAYLRTSTISQKDEGWNFLQKQPGFQTINPTDEWFPGLEKIRAEFNSWDWKFGKTPKFNIYKNYELSGLTHSVIRIGMVVEKGVVAEVLLCLPDGVRWGGLSGTVPLVSTVAGQKFTPALFGQIEEAIRLKPIKFAEDPLKIIEIAATL